MSYCINPWCGERDNSDHLEYCQACGSSLLINERYRIIKPLRELDEQHPTEVFEIDNCGTRKVLKVLISNRRRLVELFQQEAQVMQRLIHSGIPRVDNYFVFSPNNGPKDLHCLIMEHIIGQNLAEYLAENGPISEELAINWLKQIFEILNCVHQEQLLHRDIKPTNIMLRPNGQLVLLDFGTVRELTTTYVEKLKRHEITNVYSHGYTAPEQINGQAVIESDFFGIGRTFVHLLTGIHPNDLPKNSETCQIIWQDKAPQLSTRLADLINRLIAIQPKDRPHNIKELLVLLDDVRGFCAIRKQVTAQNEDSKTGFYSTWRKFIYQGQQIFSSRRSLATIFMTSVVTTSLVMGVQYLGIFQLPELWTFDRLLRLRPQERADPRLLIIEITEADIRQQQQRDGSLSDNTLIQLLDKLNRLEPRVIGIDIYLDFLGRSKSQEAVTRLQQQKNLITVCKSSDAEFDPYGVLPAPGVPLERVGFSDFIEDADGVLRRHLLAFSPNPASPCTAPYSFNVILAFNYLAAEGIFPKFTPEGDLQLGTVIFQRLQARGGYQKADTRGNQILLNYRSSYSPQSIAERVTLTQVLNNQINANSVKD
ncbi:CHASE2 domain-containing protein, partial [Aetokthonos hydrillicola]